MASYDKGTAQGITKIAPGVFAVESFREEMKTYRVDLNTNRCDCPHFVNRLNASSDDLSCKHITAARAYRFQQITETARTLPQTDLEALLPTYEERGQLEIAVAIRSEIQARQQAESRDQQLKALFA